MWLIVKTVSDLILDYADLLNNDLHQRYRSWEHCYSYFRSYKNLTSEEDIDLASLHLGFYLASWGMYRGSSFLLQKDYKIHKYAIAVLLEPKYHPLWNLDLDDSFNSSRLADLIFNLKDEIIKAYVENISEINGLAKQVNVTDTLLTKILMGTMGCTPAYDRYFVDGLKENGFQHYNFNKKSYNELLEFYRFKRSELSYAQNQIRKHRGFEYPMMKLVDMYFWQLGFNKEQGQIILQPVIRHDKESTPKAKQEEKKLSTWDMVREAIDHLEQPLSYAAILQYVTNKFGNVNRDTLQRYIYRCTVNQPARVNWHPNNKERIADTEYDLLYNTGQGVFERYNPTKHGLWEIKMVADKLTVGKT